MNLRLLILTLWVVSCNPTEKGDANFSEIETTFYDHGKPRSKRYFLDDKNSFIKEVFYTDGVLRNRYQVLNDLIEGESYFYYPTGKLYSITRFRNGLKEGWLQKYRENGSMMSKQYYHNDQPGPLLEFDKKGEQRIQPRLLFEEAKELPEGFSYGYRIFMSAPVKKLELYFGELENEEYFHQELVSMRSGTFYEQELGEIKIQVEPMAGFIYFNANPHGQSLQTTFNLVAKCETSVSNFLLCQTGLTIAFE